MPNLELLTGGHAMNLYLNAAVIGIGQSLGGIIREQILRAQFIADLVKSVV